MTDWQALSSRLILIDRALVIAVVGALVVVATFVRRTDGMAALLIGVAGIVQLAFPVVNQLVAPALMQSWEEKLAQDARFAMAIPSIFNLASDIFMAISIALLTVAVIRLARRASRVSVT
jgi:hypothetical protein